MNKVKEYKNATMFLVTGSIVIIQSLLFWRTWHIFYKFNIVEPFYEKGTLLLVLVYALLLGTFANIYGGFKVGYYRVTDIIYSQVLTLIFVNLITYLQISLIAREMLNMFGIAVMMIAQIFVIVSWAYISNRIYLKLNPAMKIIIVYGNSDVSKFERKLSLRPDKYEIVNMIDINEGTEEIIDDIGKLHYDAVMLYDIDSYKRNIILKYCYDESIKVYVTPKISDIIVGSSDKFHLFDTPLFVCKNKGLSYEQALVKRFIDIITSAIMIALTLPLMIFVAAAIKIQDGGPIIFKQKRITLNNKDFEIYKFRSMVVDAEKDGIARLAAQDDGRITKVGKVIRRIRFDELPQLFNVLKGDMSIVGPRPERPEITDQYMKIMPEFEFRTKVKAGITGYAQVMGKYNTTAYDKLKLDLLYIENFSFIMDFKLMLMTIKILFMPEKTEGLDVDEILPGDIFFVKNEEGSK